MNIFNDDDIIREADISLSKNNAKNLSYGFFTRQILEPAIEEIKRGCCSLNIYLSHTDINDFIKFCKNICSKYNMSVNFIDCSTLNNISDPALFIQHLPKGSIIIICNPTLLPENKIKDNIKNILFNHWKDKEIDIEKLLRNNNAANYILTNGNKKLNTNNYAIIYVDKEDNADYNFSTLAGTKCYGEFMIAKNNYKFIDDCYFNNNFSIKELIDFGGKIS